MPQSKAGFVKRSRDFESYLFETGLSGFDNEQIAKHLDGELQKHLPKGVNLHIDGSTIRRVRNPNKDLNPRTMWRLWISTGKKVRSLKPSGLNHLEEWLYEHDLTAKEFSKKIGMAEGTIGGVVHKGATPSLQTRQKLYEATKLSIFAPEGQNNTSAPNVTGQVSSKTSPSVSKNGEDETSLRNSSENLTSLTNREIAAKVLLGLAELLQTEPSRPGKPEEVSPADFDDTSFENFVILLDLLENQLDYWSAAPEEELKEFIARLDIAKVLKIGTGLTNITREQSFASWKQHKIRLEG